MEIFHPALFETTKNQNKIRTIKTFECVKSKHTHAHFIQNQPGWWDEIVYSIPNRGKTSGFNLVGENFSRGKIKSPKDFLVTFSLTNFEN